MCLKQTKNTTFLITQVRKRHPKDIFDTSFLQPQDVFMKTAKTHFKDIFVAFFVSTRRCINEKTSFSYFGKVNVVFCFRDILFNSPVYCNQGMPQYCKNYFLLFPSRYSWHFHRVINQLIQH